MNSVNISLTLVKYRVYCRTTVRVIRSYSLFIYIHNRHLDSSVIAMIVEFKTIETNRFYCFSVLINRLIICVFLIFNLGEKQHTPTHI